MKKILKIFLITTFSLLVFSCASKKIEIDTSKITREPIQIIPEPKTLNIENDVFVFSNSLRINNKSRLRLKPIIQIFKDELFKRTNIKVKTGRKKTNCIILKYSKEKKSKEWYKLEIKKEKIILTAKSEAGFLYGFYTIIQLLPKNKQKNYSYISCLSIEDEPRFEYRGIMLDVSRHFFEIEAIKGLIDKMAILKLNKLHLHLTDDSGFRFPFEGKVRHNHKTYKLSDFIKKTSYRTAKNKKSVHGRNWQFVDIKNHKDPMYKYRKNAHGGCYTKKELKDLIYYAKQRNIEIIPEMDIPGHSYPLNYYFKELRCDKKNSNKKDAGILTDLCPSSELAIPLLKEMIKQIADVFESPVLHIGFDEVKINPNSWYKIGSWHFCSRCEKKIKELEGQNAKVNYKNLQKLQANFLKEIETIIENNDKKMAIWNDGLRGNFKPSKNTIVYFWNNHNELKIAKKYQTKIINCNQWNYYFDLYQSSADRKSRNPRAQDWNGSAPTISLKKVYTNNPAKDYSKEYFGKNQIGLQANMWTEKICGFKKYGKSYTPEEHLYYMLFPRTLALAERAWSPENKINYDNFIKKVKKWQSVE